MRVAAPLILNRVYRKLRKLALYPTYKRYLSGIGNGHLLQGIPSRLTGDASGDPTEFFDRYDAFAYWATR
jgi:hypothetical protein